MVERISTKREPSGSILEREFVVKNKGNTQHINFKNTAKGYDFNEYATDGSINYHIAFSDIKNYLDRISNDNEVNLYCMTEKSAFNVKYVTIHEKPTTPMSKFVKQINVETTDSISKITNVVFNRMEHDEEMYVSNIKTGDNDNSITNSKLYAVNLAYQKLKDDYDIHEISLFEEYGDVE